MTLPSSDQMTDTDGQVYILALRKVHQWMLDQGYDASALFADTGLRATDMADPYHIITHKQARAYYKNVVGLAGAAGPGLEIGQSTSYPEIGAGGLAQLSAKTVGDAIEHGLKTLQTYHVFVDWTVETSGGATVHQLDCSETDPDLRLFILERAMASLQAGCQQLLGEGAAPLCVNLSYAAPANIDRYESLFRCPLNFNQPITELHYPSAYLNRELPGHDPESHELLASLAENLVHKLRSTPDLIQAVSLILTQHEASFPSLQQVAEQLAMSPRTLRRRLADKDISFQKLLNDVRREKAEQYLASSSMTIDQISERCGFAEAKNFSHAFKGWTGQAPTDYRKSKGN